MTDSRTNAFGQPIGLPVEHWTERARPPRSPMVGRYCRLEPLDAERHARDLFEAYSDAHDERDWTYLVPQKPTSLAAYRDFLPARRRARIRCGSRSSTSEPAARSGGSR